MTSFYNSAPMPDKPEDPFSAIKDDKSSSSPPPGVVKRLHQRDDLDASVVAHHHTLGIKHVQSSYGDHNHDARTSRRVGTGLGLTITGSKAGNAAIASIITMLARVIEFTDNTTP